MSVLKYIPEGIFDLNIFLATEIIDVAQKSTLLNPNNSPSSSFIIFEDKERPTFEVSLKEADIHQVVSELIKLNLEADIQARPFFEGSDIELFIRNRLINVSECFVDVRDQVTLDCLEAYSLEPVSNLSIDGTEYSFFELEFDPENIHEVVSTVTTLHKSVGDSGFKPVLFKDHQVADFVDVTAFLKNPNIIPNASSCETVCFVGSKTESEIAHYLAEALGEMHKSDIHQADQIVLNRIHRLHPLDIGWMDKRFF